MLHSLRGVLSQRVCQVHKSYYIYICTARLRNHPQSERAVRLGGLWVVVCAVFATIDRIYTRCSCRSSGCKPFTCCGSSSMVHICTRRVLLCGGTADMVWPTIYIAKSMEINAHTHKAFHNSFYAVATRGQIYNAVVERNTQMTRDT